MLDHNDEDQCDECELIDKIHDLLMDYHENTDLSIVNIIGILERVKQDIFESLNQPDEDDDLFKLN